MQTIDAGRRPRPGKMAIGGAANFHMHMGVLSRSRCESAVAHAAYISGSTLHDLRRGVICDYEPRSRNGSVYYDVTRHPPGAEWCADRERLWNEAEFRETRRNSTVGRKIDFALPAEIDPNRMVEVVDELSWFLVERYGVAVDVTIHCPRLSKLNWHAHLLLTTRSVDVHGLGPKTRILDCMRTGRPELVTMRAELARLLNRELQQLGLKDRVSHLSYAARGIRQIPMMHLGKFETQERHAGRPGWRENLNGLIRDINQLMRDEDRHRAEAARYGRELASLRWQHALMSPARLKQRVITRRWHGAEQRSSQFTGRLIWRDGIGGIPVRLLKRGNRGHATLPQPAPTLRSWDAHEAALRRLAAFTQLAKRRSAQDGGLSEATLVQLVSEFNRGREGSLAGRQHETEAMPSLPGQVAGPRAVIIPTADPWRVLMIEGMVRSTFRLSGPEQVIDLRWHDEVLDNACPRKRVLDLARPMNGASAGLVELKPGYMSATVSVSDLGAALATKSDSEMMEIRTLLETAQALTDAATARANAASKPLGVAASKEAEPAAALHTAFVNRAAPKAPVRPEMAASPTAAAVPRVQRHVPVPAQIRPAVIQPSVSAQTSALRTSASAPASTPPDIASATPARMAPDRQKSPEETLWAAVAEAGRRHGYRHPASANTDMQNDEDEKARRRQLEIDRLAMIDQVLKYAGSGPSKSAVPRTSEPTASTLSSGIAKVPSDRAPIAPSSPVPATQRPAVPFNPEAKTDIRGGPVRSAPPAVGKEPTAMQRRQVAPSTASITRPSVTQTAALRAPSTAPEIVVKQTHAPERVSTASKPDAPDRKVAETDEQRAIRQIREGNEWLADERAADQAKEKKAEDEQRRQKVEERARAPVGREAALAALKDNRVMWITSDTGLATLIAASAAQWHGPASGQDSLSGLGLMFESLGLTPCKTRSFSNNAVEHQFRVEDLAAALGTLPQASFDAWIERLSKANKETIVNREILKALIAKSRRSTPTSASVAEKLSRRNRNDFGL